LGKGKKKFSQAKTNPREWLKERLGNCLSEGGPPRATAGNGDDFSGSGLEELTRQRTLRVKIQNAVQKGTKKALRESSRRKLKLHSTTGGELAFNEGRSSRLKTKGKKGICFGSITQYSTTKREENK